MKIAGVILLVITGLLPIIGTALSMTLAHARISAVQFPGENVDPEVLRRDIDFIPWSYAAAVPTGILGVGLLITGIISSRKAEAALRTKPTPSAGSNEADAAALDSNQGGCSHDQTQTRSRSRRATGRILRRRGRGFVGTVSSDRRARRRERRRNEYQLAHQRNARNRRDDSRLVNCRAQLDGQYPERYIGA